MDTSVSMLVTFRIDTNREFSTQKKMIRATKNNVVP